MHHTTWWPNAASGCRILLGKCKGCTLTTEAASMHDQQWRDHSTVDQGSQSRSIGVHASPSNGQRWTPMDGFGCHWIILDLEGGYLTQMVHHGITKLEIDVCGLQLTQSLFHQQPWPSICISHTASLSMHASKEVPCVLCNVYIVQTRQELSSRKPPLRYRRRVGAVARRIKARTLQATFFTFGAWTGMEQHGLMDRNKNSMDSSVIHASPRQSICVQLSPVNCDPCGSIKFSMKSKGVVTHFHRCLN